MLKINLLPPRVRAARQKRVMTLLGVAAGLVLLTIPVGFWYAKHLQIVSLRARVKLLDKQSAEFAGVIEKMTALESQETLLVKKLDVLDKLTARQSAWIRVLELLSSAQASARDLWLTSAISTAVTAPPEDNGKTELTISGFAFSIASVEAFVTIFSRSELGATVYKRTMTPTTMEGQPVVQFVASFRFKV